MPSSGWDMRRALTTSDLRRAKATRDEFLLRPRRPITVVLDGVTQNYNIGAIFRLCDAFLVQELVVCGAKVELHKRKLVQAAQGTQPVKARGAWVVFAEQTTGSVRPEELAPMFPVTLVLGGERSGVSPEVINAADGAVVIPMLGMANSLNVATTAAIMLYWLTVRLENIRSDLDEPWTSR